MRKFLSLFAVGRGLMAVVFGALLLFSGFFAGFIFSDRASGKCKEHRMCDRSACHHKKWKRKHRKERGHHRHGRTHGDAADGRWQKGGYDIGDVAADFSLRGVDGSTVSLGAMDDAKGFIVVFTCNTCPYSLLYEERIIALDNKYRPLGYPVIAINSNDPKEKPGDSYEEMQIRAKEYKYPFSYLFDETQATARAYGARKTPHVFVLRREQDKHIVAYIGGIDDNYKDAKRAKKKYVERAVDALLQGRRVVIPKTKAIGCGIKWRRS